MIQLIIGIVAVAFVLWAILDILRSKMKLSTRIFWLLLVIILPILGSVIYFFMGRK